MGPLADLLVKLAAKHPETVAHFDQLNGLYKTLTGSAIKTEQLHSTLGRIIGRAVRCCVLKDTLSHQWKALVDNIGGGPPLTSRPRSRRTRVSRVGFEESAARHALPLGSHQGRQDREPIGRWCHRPGTRARATSTTSPASRAIPGGHPVADPAKPLEVVHHPLVRPLHVLRGARGGYPER